MSRLYVTGYLLISHKGIRAANSIDRSVERIHMYQALDTIKIEAGNKKVQEIADEICAR